MNRSFLMCLACVVAVTHPAPAEVQVNVRSAGSQANPAVAAGGDSVVIVWSSYFTAPGRSNDILARRLDHAGSFITDEFQVNVTSEGNQTAPAAALDSRGGLAVAWQGPGVDQEDIFLRLFDPNGAVRADERLVNLQTEGRQLYPRIAAGDSGMLVVVWESRTTTEDGDRFSICAQLLNWDGAGGPAGEIVVDDVLHDYRYPDVAMDGSGRFLVTWLRETGADTIMARLFDPNGAPATEPFAVSTAAISSLTRPSVAMNSRGYSVIAWDGDPNRASDDDVHARLYEPNAAPLTDAFVVNTVRGGAQQWPKAAINEANELVVVWEHGTGDPNVATDIFARRFGIDGQPAGEQLQLNTYTPDRQRNAGVALFGDGSFLAAWDSNGQDGSAYGIFAHFEPADPNGFLAGPN